MIPPMKLFRKFFIFILLFFIFSIFNVCWSAKTEEKKLKSLQAIEFLTGFGNGDIKEQDDYNLIPLFIDIDFNLKPFTKKIGLTSPGILQFVFEPFISYVSSPNDNVEVGNNFLIKIGFVPESAKFQPYFKGGLGLIYMSQHTREQSTQFNFNEYAGIGTHYFFKKNIAFTVEYRFRHISNAGRKHPNSGINTYFGICGISYLF